MRHSIEYEMNIGGVDAIVSINAGMMPPDPEVGAMQWDVCDVDLTIKDLNGKLLSLSRYDYLTIELHALDILIDDFLESMK